MTDNKKDILITMQEEIKDISYNQEDEERIRKALQRAIQETNERKVILTRKQNKIKKNIILWRNRFYYGVHWKKPLYPLRLLRNALLNYFYSLFSIKKHILRGMSFNATYKCNYNCNHCLCAKLDQSTFRKEMEPKDYRRIVKEGMALGAMSFDNAGGEPFVSQIWEELILACRPKYNYVYITTNGHLFNDARARRCANLGVTTIYFSLDSGKAEMHDLFRRKRGSYDRVMNGIKLCRKYGLKVILNIVVHRGNLYTSHFREALEFSEREKILINVKMAKAVGNFSDKNIMLTDEDLEAFYKIIAPYNYAQTHLDNNYGRKSCCPGTKASLIITPYGDVLHCAEMHVHLGNVMKESIKSIRERALKETIFGRDNGCYLNEDPEFMKIYYSKMNGKDHVPLNEFKLKDKYSINP